MPDSSSDAYPYLEEALPGFHRGRVLVKAAGDSLAGQSASSAVYEERKCDACTLQQFCVPQAMRFQCGAEVWFRLQISNLQSYISDYLAS